MPDKEVPLSDEQAKGLGDMVESMFAALGATKTRMEVLAMALGWDDCKCEDRKEWLNSLGRRLGFGG